MHTHRAAVTQCSARLVCSAEDSSERSVPGRILVVLAQREPTENPPGVNNDGREIPRRGRVCLCRPEQQHSQPRNVVFTTWLANNMLPNRTHETNPTPPGWPIPYLPLQPASNKQRPVSQPWCPAGSTRPRPTTARPRRILATWNDDVYASACRCRELADKLNERRQPCLSCHHQHVVPGRDKRSQRRPCYHGHTGCNFA